ncbi:hypothetical protein RCL1_005626 [Eukaryota sp. TZLM3-RCL]
MDPSSHILFSLNFLLIYFAQSKIKHPIWFLIVFGVFGGWTIVDFGQHLPLGKPHYHRRIFTEEPLGLMLWILPICGVVELVFERTTAIGLFFTVCLHILCDYINVPHRVGVLDPLVEHVWWISPPFNIFQSVSHFRSSKTNANALLQEAWFIAFNVFLLPFNMYHYFDSLKHNLPQ